MLVLISLCCVQGFTQQSELTPEQKQQRLRKIRLLKEKHRRLQQQEYIKEHGHPPQKQIHRKVRKKVDEEDPDTLITNKRLRAESGSKSKWSMSTSLSYWGGSLEKPFDKFRPNIKGAAATSVYTSLDGSISVKWNMTKVDSLFAGVGVRMVAPFAGSIPKAAGKRYQVSEPGITYQRLANYWGVQTIFQFGSTLYTAEDLRKQGYLADTGVGLALAYDFGGSPWTIGTSLGFTYRFFDKGTEDVIGVDQYGIDVLAGSEQYNYTTTAFPFVEWTINDTFNIRTVFGLLAYDHPRNEKNFTAVEKNKVYQSVGLGISVTRDIFLYPNVQFLPDNARSDVTNWALSVSINTF